MWDETIQAVLVVLAQALIPLVLAFVVGLIGVGIQWVKSKMKVDQYDFMVGLITQLVLAAEQTFPKEEFEAKKAWVIQQAEEQLAGYGLNIDLDELVAILEAAVITATKDLKL